MRSMEAVTEFFILLRIQLSTFRMMGPFAIMISGVLPVGMMFVLRTISGELPRDRAIDIVVGSMVMGLGNTCIATMGQIMAEMRLTGSLAYFATLPIARWRFILSISAAYLLAGLPSMAVILIMAPLIFGHVLVVHPALPLVLALGAVALSGVGAAIGLYARSPIAANVYSLAVSFGLVFLAPVYHSADVMPPILAQASTVLPTTYLARSLRTLFHGQTYGLVIDLALLSLSAVVMMAIVQNRIRWRER